jgi:hypothetical protein
MEQLNKIDDKEIIPRRYWHLRCQKLQYRETCSLTSGAGQTGYPQIDREARSIFLALHKNEPEGHPFTLTTVLREGGIHVCWVMTPRADHPQSLWYHGCC